MKDLEKKVSIYLKNINWINLMPVDLAKSIMIEGAELLELFQWENLPLSEIKKNKKKIEEIKGELADIFIYVLEMSVLLDLDTEQIISRKLAHAQKKYPAKLMKQSKGDSTYWKIKKEYRKKK